MKNSKLSEELTLLTTRLMMCGNKREIINLSGEFGKLIEKVIESEQNTYSPITTSEKTVTATIKFTKSEVANMAKTFKKEFIANGLVARIIKRESGKNSICYEIRYRRNGYNISASSTNIEEAKKKFLEKTTPKNIGQYSTTVNSTAPTNFKEFALFYFENYRKKKVAEKTYYNDSKRLQKHILPKLGKRDIKSISPNDCQSLIDGLMKADKCKTAVETYNILSCIFKTAIAFDVIQKNPLSVVLKPTYDQEHGTALTIAEERHLIKNATNPKYNTVIAIALYCGLRPNELCTAEIEGDFIKAVNSKRHKKDKSNVEYKYIPITEHLRPFLANGIPQIPNLNMLRKYFLSILPEHKLYDLRTTFYSRCKECGVDQRALDEYMGHSLGKIGNAYTDLSKTFLLEEGKKIKY